jgi:predicted MFS family arabinose efflux permease
MGLSVGPAGTVAVFLVFGLVAGLMESAERALVARLAPVRTGRGFGAYHALTGIAVLPAGLAFGTIYQRVGGGPALWTSAVAMTAAVLVWLVVSPRGNGEKTS